jgi:D-galactarolactone cycloisomerase
MKITSLKAVPITYAEKAGKPLKYMYEQPMNLVYVRVESDEGLVGYGEICDSYGCNYGRSMQAVVEEALGPLILGQTPDNIELLAAKMRGWTRRRLGDQWMIIQAISGVEIALWDLKGKAEGKSISKMLGRFQDAIRVYASGTFLEEGSPETHLELFRPCLEQGVTAVKSRIGFDYKRDLKTLAGIRKLLGDDIQIMIDGSEHFSVLTALEIARGLRDLNVLFFEEPIPQCDLEGIERLVDKSPVPIAYGEHMFTVYDFQACLSRRRADVVQPDAATCGGILEGRSIAGLARSSGAPVVLHSCAGPIALAANVHLAASAANVLMLEYALTVDRVWKDMLHDPILSPKAIRNGALPVPVGPGLGISIDEEMWGRHPFNPPARTDKMPTWSLGHV